MSAIGRMQPFKTDRVSEVERPLSVKADIQELIWNQLKSDSDRTAAVHPKADIELVLA